MCDRVVISRQVVAARRAAGPARGPGPLRAAPRNNPLQARFVSFIHTRIQSFVLNESLELKMNKPNEWALQNLIFRIQIYALKWYKNKELFEPKRLLGCVKSNCELDYYEYINI